MSFHLENMKQSAAKSPWGCPSMNIGWYQLAGPGIWWCRSKRDGISWHSSSSDSVQALQICPLMEFSISNWTNLHKIFKVSSEGQAVCPVVCPSSAWPTPLWKRFVALNKHFRCPASCEFWHPEIHCQKDRLIPWGLDSKMINCQDDQKRLPKLCWFQAWVGPLNMCRASLDTSIWYPECQGD